MSIIESALRLVRKRKGRIIKHVATDSIKIYGAPLRWTRRRRAMADAVAVADVALCRRQRRRAISETIAADEDGSIQKTEVEW